MNIDEAEARINDFYALNIAVGMEDNKTINAILSTAQEAQDQELISAAKKALENLKNTGGKGMAENFV